MISEKIEIFLEVADSLCFSTVAKNRYTTQPTISRQISALEEEWGVPLFVRTNKGLRLTPEGSIMLACCRKLYRLCEAGLQQARELRVGARDNVLRLGFLDILDVERIFMPFLQEFIQAHPQLDISVSGHSFSALRKGLKENRLDVIYTFDFELENIQEDVLANYLADLKCYLFLSDRHPLYDKPDLSIRDCEDAVFVLPSVTDTWGRERDLQMILNAQGIRNSRIQYAPNMDSVILQMRMGRGIALLDNSTKAMNLPNVRRVEIRHNPLWLVSVWKKDDLNPALSLLVNEQTVRL